MFPRYYLLLNFLERNEQDVVQDGGRTQNGYPNAYFRRKHLIIIKTNAIFVHFEDTCPKS